MIDLYFRRPLLWDYIIASVTAIVFVLVESYFHFMIPNEEKLHSMISDLATISLTLAGFVLTLMTVLISFKSSFENLDNEKTDKKITFVYFFSTAFYFQTVNHLKKAVLSLTLVAILGYILKLAVPSISWLFGYDIFGLILVFLTLWRCLLILSKIIKLQQEN